MLTFAARQTRGAGGPSGWRGGPGAAPSRADARPADRDAGQVATIARLQASAGNRAVVQLLTAQREDEKKPAATPDPKAPDAKAGGTGGGGDKTALRKAWADAGLVAGGPLFDLINDDLSVEGLVDMALPGLIGLANEGAAAGFAKGTEDTKGEVKPIGLDKKEGRPGHRGDDRLGP